MVEIRLENLNKNFANELVLNDINLTIEPGELVALLGPSGCGKTTTLKLIAGLLEPEQGDILFAGDSVIDIPTEKRASVLVFQDYLLFPHLNIAQNIAFGLKMRGVAKEERRKKASQLLKLVELPGYEQCYPHEISGGQKQRVSLARALAIDPEVLLLDEPLSNLDANLRGEMQEFILKLHAKNEMTTIFVTHDHEEAMLMSDKIAVMNQGRIEQYGRAEQLYRYPRNKFVADFFGKANYLTGEIEEDYFCFGNHRLPLKEQFIVSNKEEINTAMIRPEFIKIDSEIEAGLNLEVEVKDRKFIGERTHYKLRLANDKLLLATTLAQSSLELGSKIKVSIDYKHIWFMRV